MKRFGFGGNKKKNKKVLNIVKAIGGALCVLLLLFLVMDNFTLYWFMLFNNNDAMERRQQGSEWYGDWASGNEYSPSNPSGSSGPSGGSNYGNTGMLGKAELEAMTPEEAVAAVTKTLTDEQIRDPETAWRVFIYLMDRHGFVPNAIIGAMSYVKAEGAGMGTFTYESYWLCPGPDGNKSSRHLGNQDWLDWLDGPGYEWAAANYASRRANGESLAHAAIGIGSVQSSDVWSGPGAKTTSNATQMIQAANEKGLYWQDPGFQMPNLMSRYFVSSEPFGKSAWDVNDCPGVDPTTDNQVTAFEWSKRVLCGVGYPGWKSSEFSDTNKHVVAHAAGIDECTKLYDQYSKKDPWFYTESPRQTTTITVTDAMKQIWPCPACGAQNASESNWNCPFCGAEYDNSTYQGRVIARTALMLASKTKHMSDGNDTGTRSQSLAVGPEMLVHTYATGARGGNYACCAGFVSEVLMMSGVGPMSNYETCSYLEKALQSSGNWVMVEELCLTSNIPNLMPTAGLQPGDVIFHGKNFTYVEGQPQCPVGFGGRWNPGHVGLYVGTNIGLERWSDITVIGIEASVGTTVGYYPCAKNSIWTGDDEEVRVWRCVSPEWSGTLWNNTISALSADGKSAGIPTIYPYVS